MRFCSKCKCAMILAKYYDPDGTIPLYGMKKDEKGNLWVCIICGHDPKNGSRPKKSAK